MALRDKLIESLKNRRLTQAAGAVLTSEWQALSVAEKTALVRLIITDPEKAGKELRRMIVSAIEQVASQEIDILLSQPQINRTDLEGIL